eukprot:3589823-Pyramimonas_sp.AAC.1
MIVNEQAEKHKADHNSTVTRTGRREDATPQNITAFILRNQHGRRLGGAEAQARNHGEQFVHSQGRTPVGRGQIRGVAPSGTTGAS